MGVHFRKAARGAKDPSLFLSVSSNRATSAGEKADSKVRLGFRIHGASAWRFLQSRGTLISMVSLSWGSGLRFWRAGASK